MRNDIDGHREDGDGVLNDDVDSGYNNNVSCKHHHERTHTHTQRKYCDIYIQTDNEK